MAIDRIDRRAEAYGMAHDMVDGNDVLAVYDLARRAVDRARSGGGAFLVGIDTMRMRGHAAHDDMRYVAPDLVDRWKAKDPLDRYRRRLLEESTATEQELSEIDALTRAYAEDEARLADEAPMPDPATVGRGLWADDPFVPTTLELVRSPFAEAR
jgi:TPP-dependent pyruvate/acetoin dehydrogenase alpha subunit